jgi:CHRD domain
MKQRRLFAVLLLAALAALALAGPASAAKIGGADQGGRPFSTGLTGEAEVTNEGVPNQGDLDGTGSATITVNPGQGEVCHELSVEDIMLPAIGAHVHEGVAGENGPVVVPLVPPDANGVSSGCTHVSRELALAIIQDPENYYVNVHNMDFPDGALRGQLSK